jgi:hypothetical protein
MVSKKRIDVKDGKLVSAWKKKSIVHPPTEAGGKGGSK